MPYFRVSIKENEAIRTEILMNLKENSKCMYTLNTQDLAAVVPNLEPSGVDLLSVSFSTLILSCIHLCLFFVLVMTSTYLFSQKMICYEPSRRITARNALMHEYFKDLGAVP